MSIARRKIASARRLPLFAWLWLLPVAMAMTLAALAIRWVPFRRLASSFGQNIGAGHFDPPFGLVRAERARQIRQVIAVVARNAPLRLTCFPQALASVFVCRFYGLPCALYFGVALAGDRDDRTRDLKAHAWVMCGPVEICGNRSSFQQFRILACYANCRGIA